MRLAVVGLQLIALAVAETVVTLAYRAEALALCLLYGVLATLGWLWFTRRPPRSPSSVSAGLALDLVLIGGWLFLTGGYTNPLVSLLLLPIAVAIILVPLSQSIALTLFGIAVYTALVIWHTPITNEDHNANLAQLHLAGMWVTFAMTAAILLLVVGALARRLRQQQEQLSLMEQQLGLCSKHLQQLSSSAIQAKTAQLESLRVPDWVARLRESATLLWPAAPIDWSEAVPDCRVAVDATLDQAILNLLANALTASPSWVAVSVRYAESSRIEMVVEDHGDGLEDALQKTPGEQIVGSENGLGVGLFLSNATIQRLGGTLKARVDQHGTTMIIDLPEARAVNANMGG